MAEKNQNSGCLLPVFKFKPHRTKPTVPGTFSSDDDHASENVRKQSALINKTLALHVRYQLWFISLSAIEVSYAMCKQRMRLGCNRSKIDLALHTDLRFRHRASIYRCRDYLPEVVSAPLKFWGPMPKFFQDRYVYTAITGSAVPKNLPTFWGAVPIFWCVKWGSKLSDFYTLLRLNCLKFIPSGTYTYSLYYMWEYSQPPGLLCNVLVRRSSEYK